MAAASVMPRRPSNDSEYPSISAADKDCIVAHVLLGFPKERTFGLFHPEYLGTSGKLNEMGKTMCKQFFSYAKHREFADAYSDTLDKVMSGGKSRAVEEIGENRKERLLRKLMSDIADSVEGNNNLDPEVLKDLTDLLKKVGLLKEEEEKVEAPRRYLPETCDACRYRKFVEDGIANGDITAK